MNLFTMLTVLFVALKLIGIVAWPWWIVLAPVWLPLVFVAFVLVLAAIGELSK